MPRTDNDTWDLASSVGATATMVAAARAVATRADDPVIDDPFAEPLVRAVGVDFPIIPGIMPILNLRSMRRMVEFSGREFPDDVLARVMPHEDDPAALRAEGIAITTELCDQLLAGGAPGLHFYTLNRSKATREIFAALRLAV